MKQKFRLRKARIGGIPRRSLSHPVRASDLKQDVVSWEVGSYDDRTTRRKQAFTPPDTPLPSAGRLWAVPPGQNIAHSIHSLWVRQRFKPKLVHTIDFATAHHDSVVHFAPNRLKHDTTLYN